MKELSALEYYIQHAEINQVKENEYKKKTSINAWLRLLLFILVVVGVVFFFRNQNPWWLIPSALSMAIFIGLVKRQNTLQFKLKYYQHLKKINTLEPEFIQNRTSSYANGSSFLDLSHAYAHDLDLFGGNSLFAFLNRTQLFKADKILAEFLTKPAIEIPEIKQRQQLLQYLSKKIEFRQSFSAFAMFIRDNKQSFDALKDWLFAKNSNILPKSYKLLIYVFPMFNVFLWLMVIIGLWPFNFILLSLLTGLMLTGSKLKKVNTLHEMLSKQGQHVFMYSKLFSLMEKEDVPTQHPFFQFSGLFIQTENGSSSKQLRSLSKLIDAFDNRLNILVSAILNGLFLWDFHLVGLLEKWKDKNGALLLKRLGVLQDVDALNSLANFVYNHPDYVFPEPEKQNQVMHVQALGHPLIQKNVRVDNDFYFDAQSKVYIITGANMAGKSTFLRAVGVNLVLAMAGCPVCAKAMVFKPMQLFTGMRTADSLSSNESYFYAELKRLKYLKELVAGEKNIFFLLDEILKGTNSEDKRRGSEAFIKMLLETKAVGIIATHDISLTGMENDYPGKVKNYCFEIEIEGPNIHFDYKLKEGVTKNMNAMLLLKNMGLV